ncbi:MAG: hypothetical protein JOZ05_11430, partial [Acetobacteraceae bacterium]|nr:hypothetical protein [Acetobacteraceae bacterium]
MRRALALSTALHLSLGAAWLLTPVRRPVVDEVPPVEVELVQQSAMQQGGSAQNERAAASEEGAARDSGETSQPPPSAPIRAAQAAAPEVNLGDGP